MAEESVPFSMRLTQEESKALTLIARGEATTVTEIVRRAITQYLNPPQPPTKGSK